MTFDPAAYGPVIAGLLTPERTMGLEFDPSARGEGGAELRTEALFGHTPVADPDAAEACAVGLWLLRDEIARAHAAAQALETPEGNYWHGILHRREGDFDNAKYWFRRVDEHPIHRQLAEKTRSTLGDIADPRAAPLRVPRDWDPYVFVDLCATAVREGGEIADACRSIQQREWELLFDHSYRLAAGRP